MRAAGPRVVLDPALVEGLQGLAVGQQMILAVILMMALHFYDGMVHHETDLPG